jgi:small subunit ribosomal protein S27Ae
MAKDAKGKKKARNKPTSKKYTKYTIDGDNLKRARSCPRCGPGVFLMDAHNRHYCGKCRYTEYKVKEKPAEDKA